MFASLIAWPWSVVLDVGGSFVAQYRKKLKLNIRTPKSMVVDLGCLIKFALIDF